MSRRALVASGAAALGLFAACGPGGPPPTVAPGQSPAPPTPTPGGIFEIIPRPASPTSTPTPEPIVLQFAHWQTGSLGQVLGDLTRAFQQAAPGIVVRTTVTPFGQHFARLTQSFAAGQPPDVFLESGAYIFDHLKSSALLDLSSPMASDHVDLDRYWTEPIVRPMGGKQYAVPLWADAELVYFNQTAFSKAGLAEPGETWTWDDLLVAAERLTQGKPGETTRWGLLVVNDVVGGWGSFVASNGGAWLDPTIPRTTLAEPAAAEALQFVVDAILGHHAAPRPTEQHALTRAGQVDAFLSERVAILSTGTWEMSAALQQARFSWDVVRLPRARRTGRGVSPVSVQPISAARASRHPGEVWQLLHYFLGSSAQQAWTHNKLRLPALKDAAASYASPPPTHIAAALDAMGDATDFRFTASWQAWRGAVVNALDPAFDGRVALADAIKQAVANGDAALGRGKASP